MKKKVSLIIPCYNEKHILGETIKRGFSQKYKNKEIIIVADNPTKEVQEIIKRYGKEAKVIKNSVNLGLGGSLNRGIMESKGEIIVTLLADCLPKNNIWLDSLIKNFDDPSVVAVASKVKNDDNTFDKFDPVVKDIMHDMQKVYSPGLDEKGCAYRKSVLEKVGLFDSHHFKTAGEDFDMYQKMSKEGKIVSGNDPYVIHVHPLDLKKIYGKEASYARACGTIIRVHKLKVLGFKRAIKKNLFPLWGIAKGIKTPANYSKNKIKLIYIYVMLNWIYLINFIRALILGRQ